MRLLLKRWNSLINTSNEKCNTMPVQINEVIIKAVVDPKPSSGTGNNEPECPPDTNSGEAAMVEKLLEILREKQER
jgi:hypothetical protein